MHEKANVNDQNQAASYLMEAALNPGGLPPPFLHRVLLCEKIDKG